jgi:3-methyladenine DNA glycosylase/8-oxoguanine DNA glycosylase
MLALRGQGRHDQLPAGDLGLLKLAGRLLSGGDPHARAEEHEVRELFAPYGRWAGLAAAHTRAI